MLSKFALFSVIEPYSALDSEQVTVCIKGIPRTVIVLINLTMLRRKYIHRENGALMRDDIVEPVRFCYCKYEFIDAYTYVKVVELQVFTCKRNRNVFEPSLAKKVIYFVKKSFLFCGRDVECFLSKGI